MANVVGLKLNDGRVQPLAWTQNRLSVKQLRKACRKFRFDPDVSEPISLSWWRLYQSVREMKRELPRYGD